jgi:hypothetical protein
MAHPFLEIKLSESKTFDEIGSSKLYQKVHFLQKCSNSVLDKNGRIQPCNLYAVSRIAREGLIRVSYLSFPKIISAGQNWRAAIIVPDPWTARRGGAFRATLS